MPVPVHLISGFLGTGKTTAIRAQLEARRGERIAVVVNDFGEASLDEVALSESEPFRITNIPGGCVCCTAPEGFVAALGAVLEGRPDRLLIEPTGLARPQDLVDTLRRCEHRQALALGPVVVLVDPHRLGREEGPERSLVQEQVQGADVVVANRTDLCSPEELRAFEAWAAGLWPEPLAVHQTRHGRIPAELLEWPEGKGPRLPGAPGARSHVHSSEGFEARSWCWSPELLFARERLEEALGALLRRAPDARFKGIFRTREGVFRFELAGGRLHQEPTAHRRDSRADLIGAGTAPFEATGAALAAAILSAAELRASERQIEVALPDGRMHVLDREWLAALPEGVPDVAELFPKRRGEAARLSSAFAALGIAGPGRAVVVAADGFASEAVELAALGEGVLLHSLAGEALPADQGGPFRLLIPEGHAPSGCSNVKAVARIVIRP